jgi:hypothetical protein
MGSDFGNKKNIEKKETGWLEDGGEGKNSTLQTSVS